MAGDKFSVDAGQIERVVREVLRRLGEKQNSATGVENGETNNNPTTGDLLLSGRLVTLADLDGRLEGVKQLVVPRGAVLTPAVHERLRDAQIVVSYRTKQEASRSQRPNLVLGVAQIDRDPATLVAALGREAIGVEPLAHSGLPSVIDEMSDEVRKGGKMGLLITGAIDLALCLANRHAGVRAVRGVDAAGVRRAVESFGANMLVLDPVGSSLFQQIKIVREFVVAEPRSCPAELANILG